MKKEVLIVVFLTIIGGFLRFYNLNWDGGYSFHPDERNIANAVSHLHFFDQLNPDFFSYGGFLIYLYRITGDFLVRLTNNSNWTSNWEYINLIGRSYSALFSTLTIPLIFLLAKKVFNKSIALTAIIFAIFTTSFIQTAHFGITENFLTLAVTSLSLLSLNLYSKPSFKNYLKPGLLLGTATATKIIAVSFLILPLTAYFLSLRKNSINFPKKTFLLFILLTIAGIAFAIFSPHTFLSWPKFIESMRYESGVALGVLSVPYTLQFDKTISYLFQIKNLFWQMGPIAPLGVLGFIFLLFYGAKARKSEILILLSFPVLYFLYVGSWHAKFIRFMLPLLPFLIIFASWLLFEIRSRAKLLGNFLIYFFCLLTIVWVLAFFSVYTREQTRVLASHWIYQNIPPGSKILGEHWDDGLPISLSSFNPAQYQIEQLTIYESDNEGKIAYYANKLASADYIIINSRRLYGTLINLPEKYPLTSRYYKLLFSGKLGYEKIAEFSSYPTILGIEINDDGSEETFQVYDHPKVLIFTNKRYLSPENIKVLLSL